MDVSSVPHNIDMPLRSKELVGLFRKHAGIKDYERPDWFIREGLTDVGDQPDEEKLVATAERIWPYLDWMDNSVVDANRSKWYLAVVRQRQTSVGWLLDHKVHRRH